MTSSVPQTMKAHLYTSTAGGVEKNLTYSASARTPPTPSKPSQLLIKVLSTSLNPADYKVPEQSTILGKVLVCRTPASPGLDFAGRVVATHPNHNGEFTPGDLVFGCLARPREFGTLGEYILANTNDVAHLPDGVSVDEGACLGVAARTAWQALKYYVPMPSDLASSSSASSSSSSAESAKGEKNDEQKRVFINGSSGGCGIFAVQFAKMLNCHVTVTCSSRNIDLVRDLGAD
ncbi:chaperonin 10-like protein, partial [Aspergillus egyptiacus]